MMGMQWDASKGTYVPVPDPITPEEESAYIATRDATDAFLRASRYVRGDELDALETTVAAKADQTALSAVETTVQRVDAREVPIEDFVAVAATRADAWQAAIDTALANGGKVTTRTREQTLTKGIDTKGVAIEGPGSGNAHITFTADATPVSNALVYASGSWTSLGTLASDIALNATSLTLAAAPSDVAPGDWLIIDNSTASSFSAERTAYRAGEFVQVLSISGPTVTLAQPTYAAYTAGANITVHKLNPVRPRITGLRFTFRRGTNGIVFDLAANPYVADLVLRGTDYSHLSVIRSVNVRLAGIDAWDDSPTTPGLNYGVVVSSCQHIEVADCFLETARHGFTTGASGGVIGSHPVRGLRVRGGRISGLGTLPGFDFHGSTEYAEVLDVNMPNGCNLSGDHIRLRGGRISRRTDQSALTITYNVGWNFDIDTTIDVKANIANGLGWIQIHSQDYATRPGRLRLKAKINQGPYTAVSGNTYPVYLYNLNAAASNDVDLDLDLDIESTAPLGTGNLVWVRAAEGKGFRDIDLRVRGRRVTTQIDCSPRTLTVHDCDIDEAPLYGVYATPLATPYFTPTAIHSRDNRVRRSGLAGLSYRCTASGSASGLITSDGDLCLDANEGGTGTTTTGGGMTLMNAATVVRRNATVGDTRATTKQPVLDTVATVGTFIDVAPVNVGTVTATTRSGVTTTRTLAIP